jgi:hypothetical protein
VVLLERTLDGSVLFGFFTSAEPSQHPGQAATRLQQASQAFADGVRHPATNLTIVALCASCLGLLARSSRKPVLFGLLAFLGTWLPMVLTAGAGAAAHHVILLWPFQFLAIAAALAAIPIRWLAVAATVLLCASNFAVTNEYYKEMIRNGPAIRWTDAVYPLERRLETLRSPDIYIVDWGIFESVNLLSDNSAPLRGVDFGNQEELRKIVSDPRAAFVAHTSKYAYFPQQRATLEDIAQNAGYEEVPIEIIYDRNGRPTFDVFRFRKIPL